MFPACGTVIMSKANFSKVVVPSGRTVKLVGVLNDLVANTGGAYAVKLDTSPIFPTPIWLFHCLLSGTYR